MDYQQIGKSYTSSNQAHWFQNQNIAYRVPCTALNVDLINHNTLEKENALQANDKRIQTKKGKFGRAEKESIFLDRRNIPGPAHYFKQKKIQSLINPKINKSSFFRNYERFQKISSTKGNYLPMLRQQERTIAKSVQQNFSKDQKIGFISASAFKGTLTPSPGDYQANIIRHKSFSLYSKGKKQSNMQAQQKVDKQLQQRSKAIGPMSYVIPRSLSMMCSMKFKPVYRQSDLKMKQKITRMNEEKSKSLIAGPGRYLKIDQWCKYNGKRAVPNGLSVCSKPINQLKIYH